jgi:gliding motility-associated-like protein
VLEDSIPPGPGPDTTLFIPDGFSPNADGTNDTWEIPGIASFPQAEIELYNIWGGLIFRSAGAYTPWNGQYNGQDLPQATYYYVIDLRKDNGTVHKGSVTLFR